MHPPHNNMIMRVDGWVLDDMQRVRETNSGAGRDTGQSPQFKDEGTEAPSPQDKVVVQGQVHCCLQPRD